MGQTFKEKFDPTSMDVPVKMFRFLIQSISNEGLM